MSDDTFIGQIIAWSSTVIPSGWQLCDGTGGTPDLREKFLLGRYDEADSVLSGGSSSHSHESGVSGVTSWSHGHTGSAGTNTSSTTSVYAIVGSAQAATSHSHSITSVSIANETVIHSHATSLSSATCLPPYIALYFIMRVA